MGTYQSGQQYSVSPTRAHLNRVKIEMPRAVGTQFSLLERQASTPPHARAIERLGQEEPKRFRGTSHTNAMR